LVGQTVEQQMFKQDLYPFPKGHPIAISYVFLRTRPPSNKSRLPVQTPDFDNFTYAVNNALKRPKDRKGQLNPHPEGILFYDDNQPICILEPTIVLWAKPSEPPGLILTAWDFEKIESRIAASLKETTNYPVEEVFKLCEQGCIELK